MGAWSRTGLEATIIVSFPRAKALSFELEHNSTVSWHSCSPAYYRARNLATLDTCGIPPQVTGGSILLEGPGVQKPYVYTCALPCSCTRYLLADHGSWTL